MKMEGIIITLSPPFERSTNAEVQTLIDRGVFRFIRRRLHTLSGSEIYDPGWHARQA
ncbi:hypothetical protein QIS74_02493 [Colletotrichum tabaci]|uniref:Uncharacterized protein n=1 Tax=Colletotrichum tabaci TaxID=1209068 RepID=A0AAV9TPZ8_9PEZI